MRTSLIALALSLAPAVALAEHPVHEGKWEVSTITNIPGMGTMPGHTTTQCITHKDPVPKHEGPQSKNCKVLEQKIEGNKVTWRNTCEGRSGPVEGKGEITYARDAFEGNMVMTMNAGPRGPMTVTVQMSGKRVGECDPN